MLPNVKHALTLSVALAVSAGAAMAKHHDHDWRYYNGTVYGWDKDHHDWHGRTWSNWGQQRSWYRSNWHRVNAERQAALDADMRAQWLAFHNNRWNGSYNWNMYNNPRFLEYVRTNNPSLLTRIEQAIFW